MVGLGRMAKVLEPGARSMHCSLLRGAQRSSCCLWSSAMVVVKRDPLESNSWRTHLVGQPSSESAPMKAGGADSKSDINPGAFERMFMNVNERRHSLAVRSAAGVTGRGEERVGKRPKIPLLEFNSPSSYYPCAVEAGFCSCMRQVLMEMPSFECDLGIISLLRSA
jgi:hypothetical protein